MYRCEQRGRRCRTGRASVSFFLPLFLLPLLAAARVGFDCVSPTLDCILCAGRMQQPFTMAASFSLSLSLSLSSPVRSFFRFFVRVSQRANGMDGKGGGLSILRGTEK